MADERGSPRGRKKVADLGEKLRTAQGPESIEHEFWKAKIGDYFSSKGFKVSFEERVGEAATVDILASNANTSLAVEVETGKSDALRNIEKALSAGLTVLTVATSSEIEKKIKDQLSRQPQLDHGKVRIVSAQSCTWD